MLRWILDHWIHWRWANRLYAKALGYFWIPCPICGQHFGGHEFDHAGDLMTGWNTRKMVCRDCAGRASYQNWRDFDVLDWRKRGGMRVRSYGLRGSVGLSAGEWKHERNERWA